MEQPYKQAYIETEGLAYRTESAIEKALDHYFEDNQWPEDILEAKAGIDVYPDGTEVLQVDGVELLRFGPVYTKVEIVRNTAHCRFAREITRLYD